MRGKQRRRSKRQKQKELSRDNDENNNNDNDRIMTTKAQPAQPLISDPIAGARRRLPNQDSETGTHKMTTRQRKRQKNAARPAVGDDRIDLNDDEAVGPRRSKRLRAATHPPITYNEDENRNVTGIQNTEREAETEPEDFRSPISVSRDTNEKTLDIIMDFLWRMQEVEPRELPKDTTELGTLLRQWAECDSNGESMTPALMEWYQERLKRRHALPLISSALATMVAERGLVQCTGFIKATRRSKKIQELHWNHQGIDMVLAGIMWPEPNKNNDKMLEDMSEGAITEEPSLGITGRKSRSRQDSRREMDLDAQLLLQPKILLEHPVILDCMKQLQSRDQVLPSHLKGFSVFLVQSVQSEEHSNSELTRWYHQQEAENHAAICLRLLKLLTKSRLLQDTYRVKPKRLEWNHGVIENCIAMESSNTDFVSPGNSPATEARPQQVQDQTVSTSSGKDESQLESVIAIDDSSSDDHSQRHNATLRQARCNEDTEMVQECLMSIQIAKKKWPKNRKQFLKLIASMIQSDGDSPLKQWNRNRMNEKHSHESLANNIMEEISLRGLAELRGSEKQKICWKQSAIKTFLTTQEGVKKHDGRKAKSSCDGGIPTTDAMKAPEGTKPSKSEEASVPCHLLETTAQLDVLRERSPFGETQLAMRTRLETRHQSYRTVAIDCKRVNGRPHFIIVATHKMVYIFDCIKLSEKKLCDFLRPLLSNDHIRPIFHGVHKNFLYESLDDVIQKDTFDTQLALKTMTGKVDATFEDVLRHFKPTLLKRMNPSTIRWIQKEGDAAFAARPLDKKLRRLLINRVHNILLVCDAIFSALGDDRVAAVKRASVVRARTPELVEGAQSITFDASNNLQITSAELLQQVEPTNFLRPEPLQLSDDVHSLVTLLPRDLQDDLMSRQGVNEALSEVTMDLDCKPQAWLRGRREDLGGTDRVVLQSDIDAIVQSLGGFGSDNRAGLPRQLHRISAIRDLQGGIIGLTMRVGRHVYGNAAMIADLLFADPTKSILFLGEPGSGKTTVVRETTRLLSELYNVCIVDTSNEIGGHGRSPHPCVGRARRLMVPRLDQQEAVMIECVQNHTPEVIVIDEIGRPNEVNASRTCKNRGVRMVASAHGDLRGLLKNPELRGLVGGVSTVTIGDAQARAEAKQRGKGGKIQKTKAERAGPPIFDLIVEMRRGQHHQWSIMLDAGKAVDQILAGRKYSSQVRVRDPSTGVIQMKEVEQ